MATFKNTFIDALWRSAGMPPIALPGTSPVQYSRTPSVFIPALLAAVLSPAALTALVTAWNTLSAKLSGAAPVAPSVAAVTAGIVAESGNCDAAQPLITTALGHFSLSPPVTLIGNAGQLALSANTLQASLTSSGLAAVFAPLTLADLGDLGVSIGPVANASVDAVNKFNTARAVADPSIATATTVQTLASAASLVGVSLTASLGEINGTTAVVRGSAAATDIDAAGTACLDATATATAILAWLNSVAGTTPAIVSTGAPWSSLQAWRAAQGI